jgi:small subunit ribosomal protein S9
MDFKEYFQNNPIIINEMQKLQNYFPATWIETNTQDANEIELTPLGQRKGFFTAHVSVKGGGLTSQAKAVRLAIARAASKMGIDEKTNLRAGNLLTTDARRKERKKYGLKKARKRPQFSKR